ncbi:bifunctional 2-polyprenyl-6-hydroxyphenol methylase/3-demethylubiquinol 3-O-methyltransferase UbiG [Cyanobium sp. CH-040]|uniref:class I SAM-dependent methyltransferase n=1 Tax=Cyanobium sp. CH-040 TaxID=2823708 RepID=UPI0020CEC01E|nr:class I SAM-dependent methyltransferase [Cyanobium sp. CH-040]MCP9927882.1 class I SAM-dependent methyltransferase [Cyanobium sp. CH-040]
MIERSVDRSADQSAEHSFVDYGWGACTPHTQAYLFKPLLHLLQQGTPSGSRILDLGCGNGALCDRLSRLDYEVVGVDPSASGIAVARRSFPTLSFHQAAATPDDLQALALAPFDVVISTEVVEHCYAPRLWAAAAFASLKPGGLFICSTPYHGYLKNLALALSGRLDAHFTALWDGGHIKFWSRRTLSRLLSEAGFVDLRFVGAGRWPWLWKSMLLGGRRP